ncbi:MAG: hypothetical protein ACFFE2_00555 [Candidatus Thorarchaeota archaeon]
MKRNAKFALLLVSVFLLVILASSNVLASRTYENNCSDCHDNNSGISISALSTIDVDAGATFQLDIQATGSVSEASFILKIPADVADNDQFSVVVPSSGSLVDDNDANDLDTDVKEIHVIYNITAPAFADTYTLTVYAVQDFGFGRSHSITVNVAQVGAGPAIGAPSTDPEVPRAQQDFAVTVEVTSTVGVAEVKLQYSTDNGTTWTNRSMTETTEAGFYTGTIPGLAKNVEVLWRIVATDTNGEESVSPTLSYVVGQIPVEPIEIPQFHYGWLLGLPALIFAYTGTALEYYDEERFTKMHGIMLTIAYFLTLFNVLALLMEPAGIWSVMNPAYLFDLSNMLRFMHAWHVWLGIISMILGSLALLTHLGGWKTCNLGLPAVVLWTILGIMGIYLGEAFVM